MRWRRLVGIAIVLVAVVAVTAYGILTGYDYNALKPQIAQAVQEATGRELTLGGDLELEVGLTPMLVVENVSIHNVVWGSRPDFVTVERLEVQVALLPLLKKHIEIKRLLLVEPSILIETDASGRSNLAFTPSQQAAKSRAESETAGTGPLSGLIINELQIAKGHLTYSHGQSGKTYEVALDSLHASTTGPENDVQLDLEGVYDGVPFDVVGSLGSMAAWTTPDTGWPVSLTAQTRALSLSLDGIMQLPVTQQGGDFASAARAKTCPPWSNLPG